MNDTVLTTDDMAKLIEAMQLTGTDTVAALARMTPDAQSADEVLTMAREFAKERTTNVVVPNGKP